MVCFRDCDFDYYEVDGKGTHLTDISSYTTYLTDECDFLNDSFKGQDNIMLKTQCNYGSTFENELFLDNFDDKDVIISLFSMVAPEKLNDFISKHTFSLEEWNFQIATLGDKRIEKKVNKLLVIYYEKFFNTTNDDEKVLLEKLFFANLFFVIC